MRHLTHKSWMKWIGTGIATLSVVIAISFNSAANATDLQITPEVKQAVACFAFARYQSLGDEVLSIYLKRVGKASGTAGAVYRLGYVEGMANGAGSYTAKSVADLPAARAKVAKHMYKLLGCTINESI